MVHGGGTLATAALLITPAEAGIYRGERHTARQRLETHPASAGIEQAIRVAPAPFRYTLAADNAKAEFVQAF